MNLRIACVEAAEPPPPPPPAKVQVNFGSSRTNRKCVDAPSPVVCAANAGDRGKRVNPDYRSAGDSFEVVVEDGQVCARRLDRRDLGWGMNLQIACVEAPPPVPVDVQIGSSRSNTKCVDAPGPVACEVTAGDRGIRINSDYASAGDRFNVVAEGSQVCATRLDRPDLGWGMNLAIRCVEAPPPPPPAKVEVQFGSSRSNRKCVDAPGPVACDTDAGDRGNRINTDYASAGDRFDVQVNGVQVCARRLDRPDLGWGMNLAISCVEGQAAPPPPPPAPEPEEVVYAYAYYSSYYYYQ